MLVVGNNSTKDKGDGDDSKDAPRADRGRVSLWRLCREQLGATDGKLCLELIIKKTVILLSEGPIDASQTQGANLDGGLADCHA